MRRIYPVNAIVETIGKCFVVSAIFVLLMSIITAPNDYESRRSTALATGDLPTSVAFFLLVASVIIFVFLQINSKSSRHEIKYGSQQGINAVQSNLLSSFFGSARIVGARVLRKHWPSVIALVALTIFVWRNVIFSSDLPGGADTLGFASEIGILAKSRGAFQIWENMHFGWVYHSNFDDLWSVLNIFVDNPILLTKILMIVIFLFSAFAMYLFTYRFSRNKFGSLFASVAFVLNQFSVSMWASGHLNHLVAYALIPLTFYMYDRALRDGKFASIFGFAIVIGFNFLARLDAIVFVLPFILVYGFFSILIPESGIQRKVAVSRALKVTLGGGLLVFALYLFMVLPILQGVRASYFYALPGLQITNLYDSCLPLLESLSGFSSGLSYLWWIGRISWTSHPFLTMLEYRIIMFILPLFAFLALLLYHRDRRVLFFIFAALVSVFLAKGLYPPFGDAYVWLFYNVPQFDKLTSPYRWLRITNFSYAFLAGMTLSALIAKAPHIRIGISYKSAWKSVGIRKVAKVLPLLLIITLLPGSWIIVSPGLTTWHVPEEQVYCYRWLANQPGDFRVFPVPFQAAMWQGTGDVGGRQGWIGQDIGFRSSVWHGKTVIGLPIGWIATNDLSVFLQKQILDAGTDDLMRILGAMNVKYLLLQGYNQTDPVAPSYPLGWQNEFFSKQKGLKLVYTNGSSSVYENEYFVPNVFGTLNSIAVVGNRDVFTSVTKIENFDFRHWSLEFSDFSDSVPKQQLDRLNEFQMILFANTQPFDLVMLNLQNATDITASDYGDVSALSNRWTISNEWIGRGLLDYFTLSASEYAGVPIPVNIGTSGEYDVWIHMLYGPDRGNLSVTFDGQEIGSLYPFASSYGFDWVSVGTLQVNQGSHVFNLVNVPIDCGKQNDIDRIVLVRREQFLSAQENIKLLENSSARIVYLIDATQLFKWNPERHLQKVGDELNPIVIADDNQTLIWQTGVTGVGSVGLPVLSDDAVQKVKNENGLKITVENGSYETWFIYKEFGSPQDWSDEDYLSFYWYGLNSNKTILVWFGDWNNRLQFRINEDWSGWKHLILNLRSAELRQGSPKLSEISLLGIQMPENAPGIRYIDRATIDIYSDQGVIKRPFEASGGYLVKTRAAGTSLPLNITIVRGDQYFVSLRAAATSSNASIGIEVDNGSRYTIDLPNNTTDLKYYTVGPFDLNAGSHIAEIQTHGIVELDQFLLYNKNKNEDNVSPDDIFAKNESAPVISYEEVNPTKYTVHVQTEKPFHLILSQAYHPLWKAYLDGQEIESEPINSIFNGFYLTKAGEYDVNIEFVGQRYVYYGGAVAIITIIFALTYLKLETVGFSQLKKVLRRGYRVPSDSKKNTLV